MKKNEQITPMEFYIIQHGYRIESLYKKGLTPQQISKKLNIPKEIIIGYLKESKS